MRFKVFVFNLIPHTVNLTPDVIGTYITQFERQMDVTWLGCRVL